MNKYDKGMMETAFIWSKYSTCKRRQVAAIIAKDNNIISIGYNGTPTGLKKVVEKTCELCNGKGTIELNYKQDEIICGKCGGTGKETNLVSDNECEEIVYKCVNCDYTTTDYSEIAEINSKNQVICKKCNSVDSIVKTNRTRSIVVHAEQNALSNAVKRGISTEGATIYVTTAPCPTCAVLIHQSGIKRVVYYEDYHRNDGIKVLKRLGVEVEQYIKKD